jgi:hypothetical protein
VSFWRVRGDKRRAEKKGENKTEMDKVKKRKGEETLAERGEGKFFLR